MLRERFEEIKEMLGSYDVDGAICEMVNLASEYSKEEMVDSFISEELMDDFVKARMENGGWAGVACCLAKVETLNCEWYLINGYGNLEEVSKSDVECHLHDLERELAEIMAEEEEEECLRQESELE